MGCCGKKTGDGDNDIEMTEKAKWGKITPLKKRNLILLRSRITNQIHRELIKLFFTAVELNFE